MFDNRICSKCPINYRDTQNDTSEMNVYDFVGMGKNHTNNIEEMPLAMAYVPYQQWEKIYEPNEAFKRGTIFKELDLPFKCAKGCK